MRNFVAATVAATLIATSAFAATATAPLPSGKAAGTKKAQAEDNTVWYLVAGGFIIGGAALIGTGGGSSLVTGTLSTTTTTST
jgi:hypothetical protein